MIVAGFGFRQSATLESLRGALAAAAEGRRPTHLATLEDKAGGLRALADELSLPLVALPAHALTTVETWTASDASLDARGTGSVAEATALAAAGPGGRLTGPRQISEDRQATCAIALCAWEISR